MRFTWSLLRNLNKPDWNRRVWEIGYRGDPRPKLKATGRHPGLVGKNSITLLRQRFIREYNVMRWLSSPYITKEQEEPYIRLHGTFDEQIIHEKEREKQAQMPGEPKKLNDKQRVDKRRANIGNLLHSHRTVEDSMFDLIRRNRWD